MNKRCLFCDKLLPPRKLTYGKANGPHKKFCDDYCRATYWRIKNSGDKPSPQ